MRCVILRKLLASPPTSQAQSTVTGLSSVPVAMASVLSRSDSIERVSLLAIQKVIEATAQVSSSNEDRPVCVRPSAWPIRCSRSSTPTMVSTALASANRQRMLLSPCPYGVSMSPEPDRVQHPLPVASSPCRSPQFKGNIGPVRACLSWNPVAASCASGSRRRDSAPRTARSRCSPRRRPAPSVFSTAPPAATAHAADRPRCTSRSRCSGPDRSGAGRSARGARSRPRPAPPGSAGWWTGCARSSRPASAPGPRSRCPWA